MAVTTYLKGVAMGAADIIPGVSGGTIALITGIYTQLVDAVKHVVTPPTTVDGIYEYFEKIDYRFLLTLLAGIVTALLALSWFITYLIRTARSFVYAFFTGVILASAVYICKDVDFEDSWDNLVTGALTGLVVTGIEVAAPQTSLIFLFVSGALAITAMILPGISGAFILVILGQYEPVLASVKQFQFLNLFVFGLGAIAGLAVFTHPLQHWLHRNRDRALTFLTGMMLGAVKTLLAETFFSPVTAVAGLVGILVVYALHRYE